MASYLRGWLSSPFLTGDSTSVTEKLPTEPSPPGAFITDDEDETETVRGDSPNDDDIPPAFPSINSAQRLDQPSTSSTASTPAIPRILTDSNPMPPPPLNNLASARRPATTSSSSFLSVSSGANTLGVPSAGSSLAPPLTTLKAPSKNYRNKVALAPGHGPLDWANLKKSGQNLRGVDSLQRVTPAMLKEHRSADDAWTAINGKVYNITAYLPYHPGGEKELMRVAGRDGTKLFALTHAWVNVDFMLDECLVGFLVPGA